MASVAVGNEVRDDRDQLIPPSMSSAELHELTSIQPMRVTKVLHPVESAAPEIIDARWVYGSAILAAISFLLFHICDMNFCDPDMWHEMALFREALTEGWVQTTDHFAFTPTVNPVIHHEWGSGAIFYYVTTTLGAPGIMVFKYLLVAGVVGGCCLCARWRGASLATFLIVAPAVALFSSYGFTTIRAQVFTLLMLTVMLCCLEIDRRGGRWWIALWLPLHLVWLNLHAGFIVGSGLMALHACEQALRRRPFWHFVPVGAALTALIFVNPYGNQYLPYLMHGLTMARPLIVEWNPLWQHDLKVFLLFLLSLLPVGYAVNQLGIRRMAGILVLLATAYAALRHTRHLSLYCVVWACYVPSYLQEAQFGTLVDRIFSHYGRLITQISVVVTMLCVGRAITASPWQLLIPTTNEQAEQGLVCYPVGAVDYLQQTKFRGNVMLPFEVGGYAMWKLYPNVKVSIDGRYEVAYQEGLLEEHLRLFAAKPGWQTTLTRYATDAVLVPRRSKLASEIPSLDGWSRAYDDGVYSIYTRPGLSVAAQSLNCSVIHASIP